MYLVGFKYKQKRADTGKSYEVRSGGVDVDLPLVYSGVQLERVGKYKYLGLEFIGS